MMTTQGVNNKNTESSYFEYMKYEDIQNDYQAYWHIIKDKEQAPALIANCMRNVMEYFSTLWKSRTLLKYFKDPNCEKQVI